uniref:EFHB C-terminal EF-hand domain-containing protein n=1 Tax=Timema bartmani TaxID=61472 RepID=A0A7R9I261_9NEOP|nr:unnamed protein product [Timema bartmani]
MSKLLSSLPSRLSAFTMAWECIAKDERKKENLIARIIREDKRLTSIEKESSSLALQVKALKLKLFKPEQMSYNYQKVNDFNDKQEKNSKSIDELKRKHSSFFSGTTEEDKSVWLADSGASLHMTFRRDFFSELRPVENGVNPIPVTQVELDFDHQGQSDLESAVELRPVVQQQTDERVEPQLEEIQLASIASNRLEMFVRVFVVSKPREKEEIRGIFSKIGVKLPDDLFNVLWQEALTLDRTGAVCIETFRNQLSKLAELNFNTIHSERQVQAHHDE